MPVIYVKLHAILQPNGSRIDFFLIKWDHYFIFGFLCLIKPDSDRINTLEPFISQTRNQEIFGQKLADYAVDCLWILVIVMQ